jgi:hypothetical protein
MLFYVTFFQVSPYPPPWCRTRNLCPMSPSLGQASKFPQMLLHLSSTTLPIDFHHRFMMLWWTQQHCSPIQYGLISRDVAKCDDETSKSWMRSYLVSPMSWEHPTTFQKILKEDMIRIAIGSFWGKEWAAGRLRGSMGVCWNFLIVLSWQTST